MNEKLTINLLKEFLKEWNDQGVLFCDKDSKTTFENKDISKYECNVYSRKFKYTLTAIEVEDDSSENEFSCIVKDYTEDSDIVQLYEGALSHEALGEILHAMLSNEFIENPNLKARSTDDNEQEVEAPESAQPEDQPSNDDVPNKEENQNTPEPKSKKKVKNEKANNIDGTKKQLQDEEMIAGFINSDAVKVDKEDIQAQVNQRSEDIKNQVESTKEPSPDAPSIPPVESNKNDDDFEKQPMPDIKISEQDRKLQEEMTPPASPWVTGKKKWGNQA